ncbi:hypothetical protein D3C77_452510 [compost metagenome]
MDFAVRPGRTATHVSASVNSEIIPAMASQERMPALERNPIIRAIRIITTTEIALETSEVSTCPHSIDERFMGMELNRAKKPPCTSINSRKAV